MDPTAGAGFDRHFTPDTDADVPEPGRNEDEKEKDREWGRGVNNKGRRKKTHFTRSSSEPF
jgi:hypothetical protein